MSKIESVSNIWQRLPNEPTLKSRRPGSNSPDHFQRRSQLLDFDPSPRSSISSASLSNTPPSSHSPATTSVPLPHQPASSSTPNSSAKPSPHTPSALGLYPDSSAGVFSGLAFLAGRERDFGLTSFATTTGSASPSNSSAQASPTPSGLTVPSSPSSSQVPTPLPDPTSSTPSSQGKPGDNTQSALAEIFAGNPRPHYRTTSSNQPEGSPRTDPTNLDAARSYFSPPPPSSPHATRTRSQSTAAILDHAAFSSPSGGGVMTSPLPTYGAGSSSRPLPTGGQQVPPGGGIDPQTGFRPSPNSNHYSASLPPQPIGITSPTASSSIPIGGDQSFIRRTSSSGMGEFAPATYSGGYGVRPVGPVSSSVGAPKYDQTGWRATGPVRQSSFTGSTWEDEREGRSRSRGADDFGQQQRPWGDRDASVSSAGTGIGLSNMSPFSRDGTRTLADLGSDGPGAYRARREYSLGAVGSGRKRGDSVWGNSSRPLREAEDEDADDAFAPTKSGATSRRHSVSAFGARSQIGFALPESSNGDSLYSSGGGGRTLPPRGVFGAGSSAINDDDLAADLNSLHLNLEAHVAATEGKNGSSRAFSHVGSMPTNFPPGGGRYDDSSSSRSPPAVGSRQLQSPKDLSSSGGASRFFQPQQSTGGRGSSSRFEFGGVGMGMTSPTSPQGEYGFGNTTSSFRATGNTPQSGFGGPSFALPPPSPPQPFFSPPLSPGGLSAGSNAFQGFPSPGLTSPTPQQGPQGSFFPSTSITSPQQVPGGPDLSNLGRGIPLHTVPTNAPLYIVEFKAGRKDLFFSEDPSLSLRPGDLVIVEADRGKDIGKLLKPCSVDEVQGFQQRLVEMALGQLANPGGGPPPNPAAIARMTKEFTPKKIFGKAQAVDTQLLLSKAQDEVKALALIRSKVLQKNLAMEVCDAEWQWDRRKLTFYYTSGNRVDFRELVRELFRLYKTRIWMCCLDINSEAAWNFST